MKKSKSSNSSKKPKSRAPKGLVNVEPYTKKDGTKVKAHKRTFPDGIKSNNLSYKGKKNNINELRLKNQRRLRRKKGEQ